MSAAEFAAIAAAAAQAGEVVPKFDFSQPAAPTPVFAGFSFSVKAGA